MRPYHAFDLERLAVNPGAEDSPIAGTGRLLAEALARTKVSATVEVSQRSLKGFTLSVRR